MTITADRAASNAGCTRAATLNRRRWHRRSSCHPGCREHGLPLEILPTHIPLPAKIRTELLAPIEVEHDPERASDVEYVDRISGVQTAIQAAGMNRLAARRRFPVIG